MAEPEVTLGDKTVELSTLDRYKGRKGQKDRIAIVSKALVRGNSHYFNNRTFRCLTLDVEKPQICCEKLGAPTQKFSMVVFHYTSDQEGEVVDPSKCQGILKIWLLTESKYQELSSVHKQWPLLDAGFEKPQHDLIIVCTEEQYQRMTITPSPICHWKRKEAWYRAIVARVDRAKDRVAMTLGKKLTEAEVKEILGLAVATSQKPPTQAAGDIDLSDIVGDESLPPLGVNAKEPDIPF